jgi:hypothetical protein
MGQEEENAQRCKGWAGPVGVKKRAFLAVIGGLLCASLAALMAGIAFVLTKAIPARHGIEVAWTAFPMAVVFASVPAAPFGLIVGSIGCWWLIGRLEHGVPGRRLCFESAGFGAVLGATFPIVLATLGWGPFKNLVAALPFSIGIGFVCGLTVALLSRKYVAKASPEFNQVTD